VYAVFSAFVDVEYDTFVEFMTSVLPGLKEEFMVDYVRRLALEDRYRRPRAGGGAQEGGGSSRSDRIGG
jgi:hypothetical protein